MSVQLLSTEGAQVLFPIDPCGVLCRCFKTIADCAGTDREVKDIA